VIVPKEIELLHSRGINRIFSPEDGQRLGLPGIIGTILKESDFSHAGELKTEDKGNGWKRSLSRKLSLLEQGALEKNDEFKGKDDFKIPVVGITGTGGAGKSSLTDEILMRFAMDHPDIQIGVICVDPSKKKSGGALLGDRIRMNSAANEKQIFIRSFATRGSGKELNHIGLDALGIMQEYPFDFLIFETSGIGQGDTGILDVSNISMYVMTAEFGAPSQLEKIDMLDFADLIAVNKYERQRSPDALRDVKTVIRRSRFAGMRGEEDNYPVYGTIASRFDDDGVNGLYAALTQKLNEFYKKDRFAPDTERKLAKESTYRDSVIPGHRSQYLSEIAECVEKYHTNGDHQAEAASLAMAFKKVLADLQQDGPSELQEKLASKIEAIDPELLTFIENWQSSIDKYSAESYMYQVRRRKLEVSAQFETISGSKLPRVALPQTNEWGEIAKYYFKENFPGHFPYTAGVFPFKRRGESPRRMFAGEGGPARTNKRFHFLTKSDDAKRLSTAFDSVTLYGADPHERLDIYGKVGESGVSIATLDDMKLLFKGFDLCAPTTSVSMTINGPAPIILALFMNAAIDQLVDKHKEQTGKLPTGDELQAIHDKALQSVRGTVQADILKEDQAQNTCIFSTEFALKLMGDVQEYFIEKKVRNYYSVSISGYHIAEAGANPITQLALTLANGFTYVEYYRSRGMKIEDFAPNLSFFFSNGLDAEYAVLGRVARRIWAVAIRNLYNGDARSQKLKYHIQTSGRSLHAQEMTFNDIRTTLQALVAFYDNCNSLHTNAFDEAITTPTEASVRQAIAIQMIIDKEFGPNQCENINQGSYFLDKLTDVVEAAVLSEFRSISSRGGVLGAMESQYQRSKIQEESLYYETQKDTGELPIIGVNTFKNPETLKDDYVQPEIELIRADYAEKDDQIKRLRDFQSRSPDESQQAVAKLKSVILSGGNIFTELMHTVRYSSLGEITETMYKLGGKYRRNM